MKMKWLGALLIGSLAMAGGAAAAPEVLAYDEAGNYTPATFINGANLGAGFGAWDLWNTSATLGDSTAGGGGNLNSTNGYSFRFMSNGNTNNWCNGTRYFGSPLQTNDELSFTFTYNWDGGLRGVDIFSQGGKFANLINVGAGNNFSVNGTTVSTVWSPGAVVDVKITQQAAGIQMDLTRMTNGVTNLVYTTNILHGEAASGVSMYCGGYTSAPVDNVNYAIFMNNLKIVGEPRTSLTFTSGTWNPPAAGDYAFELTRSGAVGDEIELKSSNTNSVTVPASANFATGSNTVSFNATVVSLTAGDATITASNAASGLVATYDVRPVAPSLSISGDAIQISGGEKSYTLTRSASTGTNILFFSSDEAVMTVAGNIQFSPGVYSGPFPATFLSFGSATITATDTVSGAWTTFNVTYQAPKLIVSGLRRSWAGGDELYKVTREGAVGDGVLFTSSDTNVMTVPAMGISFNSGENTLYFEGVAVGAGTTALTAHNDDATSDGLSVTVEAAPDFAAYDDASLYAGGDWLLAPAHVSGFPEWTETLSPDLADSYRGRFIGGAGTQAILENSAAFGLYANYSGATPDPLPEVKVSRGFPAAMATGQTFSVDVGYDGSGGAKGFKLKGDFEGTAYERFELFNSGNDTWSYKLDGNDATITVIWSGYVPGGFVGRVQATCTAPNTFTFSFLQEGAAAPTLVENVALPGSIDQVEFYDYNGGNGDNENFHFNRMWLTTAPGEGPGPGIESAVYDSATDRLTLALPGGYSLSKVEGADCAVTDQAFVWSNLVENTDYTVEGGNVVLETAAPMPSRRIVRFGITPSGP